MVRAWEGVKVEDFSYKRQSETEKKAEKSNKHMALENQMDLWDRDEHKEWKVSKTLNNGLEEKVKKQNGRNGEKRKGEKRKGEKRKG